MSRKLALCILLQAIIIFSLMIPYVKAETGNIEIIDVHWGESGKEWAAVPGDRATLIVGFRSLIEDEKICGLKVVLWPIDPNRPFPFTSPKGGNITTYTDQQISFGDKAEITFDVKIKDDAAPGTYDAYLYFFYYDCGSPEVPLIMRLQKISIEVWPPPKFRVIDVSWLSSEGLQVHAMPGDVNRMLSVTLAVPKYYEASDVAATLYLDEHFTNLTGGREVKASYTGVVSEGGYFTLKFPLNVENDTPPGTYNLRLVMRYYDKWLALQSQEILIPVAVSGGGKLDLSIEPPALSVGLSSNMNVKVSNTGDAPIYSLKVTVSSESLVVVDGETDVDELGPGKMLNLPFSIWAPATLSEGTYSISVQAEYVDSSGIKQTLSKIIKIYVKSQPVLSISGYIKNPEIVLGKSGELMIVVENNYDSPIRDVSIKPSLEGTALASSRDIPFFFDEIPARGSVELKIPVMAPPSASTGTSYVKLSVTYRNPFGGLRTDEISLPVIIKPDVRLEIASFTLSSTSVAPGESIDISGDIYNRGLSAGKLCEVKVEASSPLIVTEDSRDYIGDISSLSKASFTVTVDVANNARPGKYSGTLIVSCSDVFGNTYQISKPFEVQVTPSFTIPSLTYETMSTMRRWNMTQGGAAITVRTRAMTAGGSSYISMLQNPIIILLTVSIVAGAMLTILLVKRRSSRGRRRETRDEAA
jgi:hypothetical protein